MAEELNKCPCGKRPSKLLLSSSGPDGKFGIATGNCCKGHGLEFRTKHQPIDSPECMRFAVTAWNGNKNTTQ